MTVPNDRARFLIIDDHPLFREALHSAVQMAYPEVDTVEARSIAEALDLLADAKPFDLALLDLSMPDVHGFDGLLQLRTRYPRLPVVIVSGYEEPRIISEALSYGAAGFIPKSARKSDLAAAIRSVMDGAIYVPETYEGQPADADSIDRADMVQRLSKLTPQQLRVCCRCCAKACSTSRSPMNCRWARPRSRRMSRRYCASSMSTAARKR
ncbi:DNA-binding NarL/FixJ family response regulator [Mesorhizobium sp. USDA 4775]